MEKIEKAVFFKNAVETLGYFSEQIAAEFQTQGIAVCFVDYHRLAETVEELYRFIEPGKTALCTFNFIGISGEEIFREDNGSTIWENREMPCLNMIVDHPLYYHSKLEHPLPNMKIFCVDRNHVSYMRRFYPGVETAFLPLAGNVILPEQGEAIPYEKRPYELVFTGNYTPLDDIYRRIGALPKDYRKFYGEIIEDSIAHPSVSLDRILEEHICRELGEVSDKEKRAAIAGMVFIDICIRSHFRGEVIKILADEGVPIHVFGAGWDRLSCKKPGYIIQNGGIADSKTCARAIGSAKLSLNLMPWFKDGAHDRVFTAMLQGAVSLTDDSKYLREAFCSGEELVFFSLEEREKLPEIVKDVLAHPETAMDIAEKGRRMALSCHTWKQRAEILWEELRQIL